MVAAKVGERTHSDLTALRCNAPAEVASLRRRERTGVSDADDTIAAIMAGDTDAWPEAAVVDTTGPPGLALRRAVEQLRPEPAQPPWVPRRPLIEPD
jgi:uncharacterized protein